MKNKNIDLDISGLKCDNKSCVWLDMSIPFEEYEEWINKPCPICGDIVLTVEEYEQVSNMVKSANYLNSLTPDQVEDIYKNMTPEDINNSLDFINDNGFKKISEGDDGSEYWTTK